MVDLTRLGGEISSLPLVGHPTGVGGGQPIDTEYRFLLADLLPFGTRAQVGIEHGGTDESRVSRPHDPRWPTGTLHRSHRSIS